jgi:hypothetical protein
MVLVKLIERISGDREFRHDEGPRTGVKMDSYYGLGEERGVCRLAGLQTKLFHSEEELFLLWLRKRWVISL